MDKIKKVLINRFGKKFYFRGSDVHTKFGVIKEQDIVKAKDGDVVKSNMNEEFFIISPSFLDVYKKIKRSPQIIPLKDLAVIVSETGVNKESMVVEAGTGSGASACFFANLVKEVITYEIRQDFLEIAKENIEFLGLKNITVKNNDIYNGIDEGDVDLILLDLPEPWKAIEPAIKSLKTGGFIVAYSPTIPQISDFAEEARKRNELLVLKISEISEREWEAKERKVRPKSQAIGHSGFMVFVRKVGKEKEQ
jgi:tRNA (adenine57-N1/adenine58-N1)-methyltransferase